MEEDEALPDHLRCNRTDGRQWRCKRRVKDNLKLCEIHYLQGRHRQYKEKVPESLKLQRNAKKGTTTKRDQNRRSVKIRAKKVEILAKLMKRKRSGESLRKAKRLKKGNAELELIRMVLKREVEKSNEKSKNLKRREALEEGDSEEELTRDLPNGLMAISSTSSSPSPQNAGSDSPCRVKIGADSRPVTARRIRSKNVEALPIGKWQVTFGVLCLLLLSLLMLIAFWCCV